MKIAIVHDVIYPYSIGGAQKRNYEIVKRLVERGHTIHWYGMKWWSGKNDIISDEGVHLHGVCKKMELYTGREGQRSIKQTIFFAFYVLVALLREKEKFDIIDCNSSLCFPLISSKIVSIIKRTPLVATWLEVWDDYWYEYLGKSKGFIGKIIEKSTLRLTDNLSAISETTKNNILKITNINKDRIKVIPIGIDFNHINGIDVSDFSFNFDNNFINKNNKLDVLFAGRLIKDKNVESLIRAINLVKKEISNVTCVIIGEGPEKEKLIKLTKDMNLEKNVKFFGILEGYEHLIKTMKISKIFAFPSTREGFGIVVIEANACGLPVIGVNSKNSRCVSELIKNKKNGYLLNCLNETLIAEKINLLLKNNKLRQKMSENGIRVAERYNWDNIIDEIESFYLKIINNNKISKK